MTIPPPSLEDLLARELAGGLKPTAVVLAGHNGSGKSTLWYQRLAGQLQIPLVNADRLTMSILPEPAGQQRRLPAWAQALRDENDTWARLAQGGVRLFRELIMDEGQAFGFETVFSYWKQRPDGSHASKIDDIKAMQERGYTVVLIFVGLASPQLSVLRVQNRKRTGGHDVPRDTLLDRFPRTQAAIGAAATVADLTLMIDNSLDEAAAFQFVRAQRKRRVLFDVRDTRYRVPSPVLAAAQAWLPRVTGPFRPPRPPRSGR